nr:hypothetical protein [uncultured Pseudoxanthomonas sp.]
MIAKLLQLDMNQEEGYNYEAIEKYSTSCAERAANGATQRAVNNAFSLIIDYLDSPRASPFDVHDLMWISRNVLAKSRLDYRVHVDLAGLAISVRRMIEDSMPVEVNQSHAPYA